MTKSDDQITQYRKKLEFCPSGDTGRAEALFNLAVSLGSRFKETNEIGGLEEAIGLHRIALDLRPEGHPDRHKSLFQLVWCLVERYRKQGTLPDLEEAITVHRAALSLRPEGHPNRSDSLYSLAACFSDRYDKHGSVADLEEAITLMRATLELRPPGHSDRALTLYWLASYLRKKFLKLSATADLDEALSFHRSALELRPEGHPNRSDSLYSLAACFSDRYNKHGSVADLEEAITLWRAALELRPPGHSDRALTLYWLASYLRKKFLKLGATTDLDEALSFHRSALELRPEGHPNRSDSLRALALCLGNWYDSQTSVADSEEAITPSRAASELRRLGQSDPATTFYSLGYYLRIRFLKVGANTDLDGAISFHRLALDLRPVGHPDRSMFLNQLAHCLGLRFEKSEVADDLDNLIALNRAILDLHPPGHDGRAKSIDELLLHLRKRRERLGVTSDLDECITLGYTALELHKPGGSDHTTHFRHLVADLQSMLRKLESASDIHDSPDHTTTLHNLVVCVRNVVCEGHVSTDMDEIVAVARAGLKLCPHDHSDHVMSVTTLATCLQHRFQQQGTVADLDEAIVLSKDVLGHCTSGNAPVLHKLASCLSERFTKMSKRADLDDAISFEQTAFALYSLDHPDRAESLNNLTCYRQLRVGWKGAAPRPGRPPSPIGDPVIVQLIAATAFEVLKAFPPRLLHTQTGRLCNRDAQIMHFEDSQEYRQLVSSTSPLDTLSQTAHIRDVLLIYFRYVTLSHRWGKSEPLLRDIENQVIYDLDTSADGLLKLQSFCLACCQRGYLWAWSDTCCIDKESSAELQEAIGSMFSWYRQSALTMVHLADVSGTGTLTSSVWFKRGWTLQELLAPHFLLFFTRDWSLYRGISLNHKEDSTILRELEQATGIPARHLTDFYPSADEARSRLQWASTRFTTRPEDISYSLFGVFGLHIPVLYGESVGNALGRLLAEVITRSGDTLVLDWVGQSSAFHSCIPATIAPYQTFPSQHPLPDPATPPNLGWFWLTCSWFFTFRAVRKMHQALSRLPLTQFINFRLILPCIVHHINTIELIRAETSTATHVHRIEVMGLEPIEIALSQPLKNTLGKVPYILIRPWHSSFLDASVMTDDTSAFRWLMKMQQPFSALLLQELPHHVHKRVASCCHILARPTDSAGVLEGKVTTLAIV